MEANSRALQKENVLQVLRLHRSRKIFAWSQILTETGGERIFGDIGKNIYSIVRAAKAKP